MDGEDAHRVEPLIPQHTAQSRRRKHTRTRTGCVNCKSRRIKCDEEKPSCGLCKRRGRSCSYTTLKPNTESHNSTHDAPPEDDSTSHTDDRLSPSSQNTLVKSRSVSPKPQDPAAQFRTFQRLLDLLSPQPMDQQFAQFFGAFPRVPRPPASPQEKAIQFFLDYHRHAISECHYLCFFDHQKLCSKLLMSMSLDSQVLQYAMVAFSMLIFSTKGVDSTETNRVREYSFVYYHKALKSLHTLLNKSPMDYKECQIAVASALQLASFDRFFADIGKCFRHLQGAARILKTFSNPTNQASTVLGRSLLEWYMNLEDYCCFLSADKALLPISWRNQNHRVRQRLAKEEYPHLPEEQRIPRYLDDIWQQYETSAVVGYIQYDILKLETLPLNEREQTALKLEATLRQCDTNLRTVIENDDLQVFKEPTTPHLPPLPQHAECCPPPPFTPRVFAYPPAGAFLLVILAAQAYNRKVLHPLLRAANPSIPPLENNDLHGIAREMCRTFAGIEYAYQNHPDELLPSFVLLGMAAMVCAPDVRDWIRHKMAHFEDQGCFYFKPVRKNIATEWNMREIETQGFRPERGWTPGGSSKSGHSSPGELAIEMEEERGTVEIEEGDSTDLVPLIEGRGMILMTSKLSLVG